MYHKDLRTAAIFMYLKKIRSCRKVGSYLNVGKSTINRWINASPIIKKNDRIRKITNEIKQYLAQCIEENPFVTAHEINFKIKKRFKINLCNSTISCTVKKLNYTKKKYTHIVTYDNLADKRTHFESHLKTIDKNAVISIDETAFYVEMKTERGYSFRGKRLYYKTKNLNKKGNKLSVLIAITTQGILGYKIFANSIKTDDFNLFIEKLHVSKNIKYVIMDNASIHNKVDQVLNKKHLQRLVMPPYSPCYNPIEQLFSLIKYNLRKFYNLELKERFLESLFTIDKNLFIKYYDSSWNVCYNNFV